MVPASRGNGSLGVMGDDVNLTTISRQGRVAAATLVASAALVVLQPGSASAIDAYQSASATIESTTYQAVTLSMTNNHAGYNMYWRVDNGISTNVYGRWVKCGYSSTQDTASSVGGSARTTGATPYQGEVGTSFIAGACTKLWNRKVSVTTYKPYLAAESYFNDYYLL